jgi:peptidoglycan hydrolase-like protein with peptidoglycan-binding domain
MHRILLAILTSFIALSAYSASAANRVALVVGISDYDNAQRLENPERDATSVAAALQAAGFDVTLKLNLDQTEFGDALLGFERKVQNAETALFYFAGHGMQINAQNYLLASNAKVSNPHLIDQDGMDLSRILALMEAGADTSIAVIDACRDNPMAKALLQESGSAARSLGLSRGLARMDQTYSNSLVAFATAPGAVALDGTANNSPFTEALLKHLNTPDLEVSVMFKRVTNDVLEATEGSQRPEVVASMAREFYFVRNEVNVSGDLVVQGGASDEQAASNLLAIAQTMPEGEQRITALELVQARFPDSAAAGLASLLIVQEKAAEQTKELAALEPPVISENRNRLANLGLEVGVGEFVTEGDKSPEEIEVALQLSQDEYKRVQAILNDLGFSLGVVDGDFGNRSRNALSEFQEQSGEDGTGFLSETTIASLIKSYETAPTAYDGKWILRINRKWLVDDRGGFARKGDVEGLAIVYLDFADGRFEKTGFNYQTLEPSNPFGDFQLELDQNGNAVISGTVSYLFGDPPRTTSPKISFLTARVNLPPRMHVGRSVTADGNRVDSDLQFQVTLSRLRAGN